MDRGLYIAASGMLAEQVRQEQIANDLANGATPGYKADRTAQRTFGDLMLANSATGQAIGPQSLATQVDEIRTDFRPADLRDTGQPLDFAIVGEGYFAVRSDRGERYTRNGQFTVSPQGQLVTAGGDVVLGADGAPVAVGAEGRVDPRSLRVVALQNPRKDGDSLVAGTPGGAATGQARAGALEGSGVDAARSMVDMIASLRAFEAGQRVITTIDQTLSKGVNDVGRVN